MRADAVPANARSATSVARIRERVMVAIVRGRF
jgi:hypothetical protein